MKRRNIIISVFVIAWTLIFHYESTRTFWLEPLLKTELPKLKFLFPPAGWIMFYRVDDQYGYAEIYGVYDGDIQLIDPHLILETRTIAYDNIHRNVLGVVFHEGLRGQVCAFLDRKFPEFEDFIITAVQHPSLSKTPNRRLQKVMYRCGGTP